MSCSRHQHGPVEAFRTGRYPVGISTHAYCYHVGRTLIDTGPPNQWRRVRSFVQEMADTRGVDRVVVTHHHEDHAGNAGRIAEMLDVPVFAPEASLDLLRDGFDMEMYRRIVWGSPGPIEAQPVPEHLSIGDGLILHAIPTPGHADDMVCYRVEGKGWLFSADLYITQRPEYLRYDEHVGALLRSIHRVLQYDITTVFCSHRGIVDEGAHALREKARYLEALCGVARRRYRQDKRPVNDIREEMLGKDGLLRWISGGDFSKDNLISSCIRDQDRIEAERHLEPLQRAA
ncbi:MBL fold metallo-hydrolase [Longibacter salinarum]|uniref:MBL fold metallo-hydrolase n=1 Tax=Longibacter salinarum TaxID=1850348 RepID=A0A2A8CWS4_9BACT|nr:MBL fold metallo-hydrolase [Longibacter salinarum]PEN13047.1 MBL fold metallo-hydrolase [Longibacter salinarum]